MEAKTHIFSVLLLFSTLTVARSEPDSLSHYFLHPVERQPVGLVRATEYDIASIEQIDVTQNNGSDNHHISPHQETFYKNLEKAASRTNFTRMLHELLIKDPAAGYLPSARPLSSETLFEEFEGKIIQNIELRTVNLFASGIDDFNYTSSGIIERTGKVLHVNTNERVIRNNLLFSQGDHFDPFLTADNERILRQLSYIEDARIYVYENPDDPEYVDVVIFTKDRLSYGFDMDMNDIDQGNIELYNKNIFGLGQAISANLLFDASGNEPFGFRTGLRITNIGQTFITTTVDYRNAFGNTVLDLNSGRDFITPSMKYAGGLRFTSSRLVDDYIFFDSIFLNQELDFNVYDSWFGRSFRLPGKDHRRNLYLTARFNRSVFYKRPEVTENIRYEYHSRDIVLMSLIYSRLAYLRSSYIYGFGPTEDIPIGTRLQAITGYEDNQFFSRWYTGGIISSSIFFDRVAYLNNSFSLGGFINKGVFEQGLIKLETSGFSTLFSINNYYLRQFFSVNYTRGINRFDDEYISISNRSGIRGLRSDMLRGSNKFALQTETMLYSKKNWYGFRYAFYTLADLGWIGADQGKIAGQGFYSGFGIGLRVRNEHLVLPTLNFRLAWFPRIPETARMNLIYIMGERNRIFDEFNVTAPDIIHFR